MKLSPFTRRHRSPNMAWIGSEHPDWAPYRRLVRVEYRRLRMRGLNPGDARDIVCGLLFAGHILAVCPTRTGAVTNG